MNRNTPETRRYDVRTEDRRWLGTFLVTHDGLVACNTDYGSYSYWWTSTGCDDIRTFLVRIGTGYLLNKFSPKDEHDPEGTEMSIRRTICELRRRRELTVGEAAREWDLVGACDLTSEYGFYDWVRDTKLGDSWELGRRRTCPQATAFAERVWPAFVRMLREEMAAEKDGS